MCSVLLVADFRDTSLAGRCNQMGWRSKHPLFCRQCSGAILSLARVPFIYSCYFAKPDYMTEMGDLSSSSSRRTASSTINNVTLCYAPPPSTTRFPSLEIIKQQPAQGAPCFKPPETSTSCVLASASRRSPEAHHDFVAALSAASSAARRLSPLVGYSGGRPLRSQVPHTMVAATVIQTALGASSSPAVGSAA